MLSKISYFKPDSLEEALDYLNNNPETKIVAGGTDLMVGLRANSIHCEHVLDIKGIAGLNKLEYKAGEGLHIGATVLVNDICADQTIREKYPALAEGADHLASYQIRNRATLVGNICNASPGADLAPALLVYEAKVHIVSANGERTVDIHEFFTGVKRTVLQAGEMVTAVSLPDVQAGDHSAFFKMARVKGHDLAVVGAAARKDANNKVRIAMNAVAPTPVRLFDLEEKLNERELNAETADWLEREVPNYISPISDVRSSKEYRLHVSAVLVRRAFEKAIAKED